jgi:hypothetical protein
MQTGVLAPVPGSNGALWTLGFEFWFYLLYPALLFLSLRLGPGPMMVAVAGVSLAAFQLRKVAGLEHEAAWGLLTAVGCWLVWACGALVAEVYAGRIRLPRAGLVGLAGATCLAVLGATTLGGSPGQRAVVRGGAPLRDAPRRPARPRRIEPGASAGAYIQRLRSLRAPWSQATRCVTPVAWRSPPRASRCSRYQS